MFCHRRVRGSAVEFALLVPLIAFLSLAFFDLARATLQQFRLERLSGALARELALSEIGAVEDLQALAESRVAAIDSSIVVSVEVRAIPSTPVSAPRDGRPIQIVDVSLDQPLPMSPVLWRAPMRLRARASEVRAR